MGGWDDYKLYIDGRGSDALLYNVGYIPEGTQQTEVLGARYRSLQTMVDGNSAEPRSCRQPSQKIH